MCIVHEWSKGVFYDVIENDSWVLSFMKRCRGGVYNVSLKYKEFYNSLFESYRECTQLAPGKGDAELYSI